MHTCCFGLGPGRWKETKQKAASRSSVLDSGLATAVAEVAVEASAAGVGEAEEVAGVVAGAGLRRRPLVVVARTSWAGSG